MKSSFCIKKEILEKIFLYHFCNFTYSIENIFYFCYKKYSSSIKLRRRNSMETPTNTLFTVTFQSHSFGIQHDKTVKRKITPVLNSNGPFVGDLYVESPEVSGKTENRHDYYEILTGRVHAQIIIFVEGGKRKLYSCFIRGKNEASKTLLLQAVRKHLQSQNK